MIVIRFALPVRSPMPLTVPCTCVAPAFDRGQRVRDRAAGVVVACGCPAPRRAALRGRPRARSGSAAAASRRWCRTARVARRPRRRPRAGSRARSRGRARSRRRSARRRAARACPRRRRNATESAIIARFSSRETRTTFSTCSTEALPTSVHDRREASPPARAAPRPARRSTSRRRVMPKATISAIARAARRASSSNSSCSLGFDDGKPASIMCTPSSSRAWTTRSFSAAVSVRPPPPMPSRRVASYSCMSAIGA